MKERSPICNQYKIVNQDNTIRKIFSCRYPVISFVTVFNKTEKPINPTINTSTKTC